MALADRYASIKDTKRKESSLCAVAKLKRRLAEEDEEWFAEVEYDRKALATDVVESINAEYGEGTLKAPSLRRHRLRQCECER